MDIDRSLLVEYPHYGGFYESGIINPSESLIDREEQEKLVFETECDIQEVSVVTASGVSRNVYKVYFPFNIEEYDEYNPFPVKRGLLFRGYMYGLRVDGLVNGVFPTQMGGCEVTLDDIDA